MDYYQTLGITRDASQEDIKRAYRKMAHKFHPDKDGGDEEKFKEINEAYQVLGTEQKRQQYDQFGQTFDGNGAQGNPFGGAGGFQGFNVNMEDLGGIGDIFEQFFGGSPGRTRTRTRRGQDISVDTTISFAQAATGTTWETTIRTYQTCSHCHGNGAEPGTPMTTCPTCNGQGTVSHTQQTPLGVFSQRTMCRDCQGEGKRVDTPCSICQGDGRELTNRNITIDIPAGINNGQRVMISGKGEAPLHGGQPGDLYVTVHVTPHPRLTRDGDNIRTEISIPFTDAILGTQAIVSTIAGEESITVPAGTQPGTEITLSNKGFPRLNTSQRGDQLVTINVQIPKRLNRRQKKAIEDFKHSKSKRFFS